MGRIIPGKYGTKKDVITKKASRLFKEKGFSATSMRDIAEAIGIEAPSLYNHISSKGEILQDICYKWLIFLRATSTMWKQKIFLYFKKSNR